MHPNADIIRLRYAFPVRVTLLDVCKQGFAGCRSVETVLQPNSVHCRVLPNYRNRKTGRVNVDVCFDTEKSRDENLDVIDKFFNHYRVH